MSAELIAACRPGSLEAVAQGCQCSPLDNNRGRGSGFRDARGRPLYWLTRGCPTHDTETRAERLQGGAEEEEREVAS